MDNKLKYIVVFGLVYIIFRFVKSFFIKDSSETYIQYIYEYLNGSPSSTTEPEPEIEISTALSAYIANLNSPSRTINIAVTLPSGAITTVPCTGSCTNCVVTSLTPSGCFVSEKT